MDRVIVYSLQYIDYKIGEVYERRLAGYIYNHPGIEDGEFCMIQLPYKFDMNRYEFTTKSGKLYDVYTWVPGTIEEMMEDIKMGQYKIIKKGINAYEL